MASSRLGRRFSGQRAHPRLILVRGETITSFTLRPGLAVALAGIAIVFTTLYLGATGYLVLRDDMLSSSLAQQIELRRTYEHRISDLRADIDRLTSRNLLAQEAMRTELARLRDRQAALDARQDVIAGLAQAARSAGIGKETKADADEPQRDAALDLPHRRSIFPGEADGETGGVASLLDAGAAELRQRQDDYLRAVGQRAAASAETIATTLAQLGVKPDATDRGLTGAVGGPFVAIDDLPANEEFRLMAETVAEDIAWLEHVSALAMTVPLAAPVARPVISSGYGKRIDPFLRKPAMHHGLDFRARPGTAVLATAPGVVTAAGRSGGYGKLVEIDHGNGLKTRFAHLSRISVRKGQNVTVGDRIGAVGSTGRSTGPHLHYEIRLNDRPVDPHPFVKAGRELAGLL